MTSKHKTLKTFCAVLYAFLLLSIGPGKTAGQTQDTPGPLPGEVRILLTAVDKDRHFVTTLQADDLRISQDGTPQKIADFRQITDRAVSLAILIDASASQERTMPAQKLAATSFVEAIIQAGRDQAAVATFTGTTRVEQKLTSDVSLLKQAIARASFVPPPGYVRGGLVIGRPPPIRRTPVGLATYTAVWDAVIDALSNVLSQSASGTRQAIVILTDGLDTISKSKMADAVERAVQNNVAIYAVGIGDEEYGVDKDGLRKLSERTGGHAFFPKKVADLSSIFAEIGQELRTQYSIVYKPVSGAGEKIRIELMNPALRNAGVQLYYQQRVSRK